MVGEPKYDNDQLLTNLLQTADTETNVDTMCHTKWGEEFLKKHSRKDENKND